MTQDVPGQTLIAYRIRHTLLRSGTLPNYGCRRLLLDPPSGLGAGATTFEGRSRLCPYLVGEPRIHCGLGNLSIRPPMEAQLRGVHEHNVLNTTGVSEVLISLFGSFCTHEGEKRGRFATICDVLPIE
jgi:hypothetical protein